MPTSAKNHILLLALCLLLWCPMPALGQSDGWQEYYDVLMEEHADDDDDLDAELIYEQLSELASHPVNLNAIDREDLEQMYFFDERQVDAVLEYVRRYGPVRSKGELSMIPYLDNARAGLLRCLTYIGEMPERKMDRMDSLAFRRGQQEYKNYLNASASKGELVAYMKVPLYDRKGDKEGYAGYKYKHWLRFNYTVNRHIKVGAVASQDAGEPFFFGKNRYGYDYYSAYLRIQRWGVLKNLVVGNYRIRTGLGLVLNSSIGFGKTFGLSSRHAPASVVTSHTSRSMASYLQGAAATLSLGRQLEATVFGSIRPIDATLDDDGYITTILKTGYHRTVSELSRKNNARQTTAGANMMWRIGLFQVGATALWNHYDIAIKPYEKGASASQLYRKYYPAGDNFFNASVNYGYKYGKRFAIEGETATDGYGHVATVNTLTWMAGRSLTLRGIQRYYPYNFWSTLGRSFSEGGGNQNENGLYLGATWDVNSRLTIHGYTDAAYFQWAKYQATGSSHCFDNLLQVTYKISPSSTLLLRYRIKLREKDDASTSSLRYRKDQRLRASLTISDGHFSWKTQADMAYSSFTEGSLGGMLGETMTLTVKPWKIALGASWFKTKDYYSRVYAFEKSTPYNMAFPAFFGHGCRVYALAEVTILKRLTAMAKLGFSHYFDRDTIGSALQQIDSSSQTDLDLMLKWSI